MSIRPSSRLMLTALAMGGAAAAPLAANADTQTTITYTITGLDPTYVAFGSETPVSGPNGMQPANFSQTDTVTFDDTTGTATISSSDPTAQIIWIPGGPAVIASDPGIITLPGFGTTLDFTLKPKGISNGFFVGNPDSATPTAYGLAETDGSGYKTTYGVVNLTATTPIVESSSPTPEPAAWALMLVGFGGVGAALRYRRAAHPAV